MVHFKASFSIDYSVLRILANCFFINLTGKTNTKMHISIYRYGDRYLYICSTVKKITLSIVKIDWKKTVLKCC